MLLASPLALPRTSQAALSLSRSGPPALALCISPYLYLSHQFLLLSYVHSTYEFAGPSTEARDQWLALRAAIAKTAGDSASQLPTTTATTRFLPLYDPCFSVGAVEVLDSISATSAAATCLWWRDGGHARVPAVLGENCQAAHGTFRRRDDSVSVSTV